MSIRSHRRNRYPAATWLIGGLLSLLGSLSASSQDQTSGSVESQRLYAFLDETYQAQVKRSPLLAAEFGERVGEDRWDDISSAGLAREADAVNRQLEAAQRQFAGAALDERARLHYRIFVSESQLRLERYRHRHQLYALNQIVGLHVTVPDVLINQQHLETVTDAHIYVRRIRATQVLFKQLVVQLQEQAHLGTFMPRSVYPLLIEGARNVITGAPFDSGPDSAIFADFKRRTALLDAPDAAKARLVAACRQALLSTLTPAYRALIELLERQAARTPVDGGVWQLPDGDELYRFLVRQYTTTDMTPAQIHALGLQQVAKVHAQIELLMHQLGVTTSLREFMNGMRTDPRFHEDNSDAGRARLLERARQIVAAMGVRITDQFERPPPLPQLKRVELYKEASSPSGFYEPGSLDGSRAGTIYLNLADMRLQPTYELEDLLYHEGIPGHHLQISTILREPAIPRARKVNEWWQDTAFVEGWGLYAEQLGKELGFYQDPYSDLGRLSGELWRATRLVVDSGLHYKRWSRDQAIHYLEENTAAPHDTIVREVDRYLAVPGQATAFTVGMLKLIEERERARLAIGAGFDVRQYHRIVLQNGFIPLWALHEQVSAWISAQQPPFRTLLESYWQETLQLDPALALSVGDRCCQERLDERLTDEWRSQKVSMLQRYAQRLKDFDPAQLSDEDRVSYEMLHYQLASDLAFYNSRSFEIERMLPINQFASVHVSYAIEASGAGDYPFKTVTDYDQALTRADAFARWSEQAVQRLRQGVAQGIVLPALIVTRILPQLQVHLGMPPEQSQFWKPIAALPADFSSEDRTRLRQAYRQKIAEVIQPAYQRLYDYLAVDYAPHARASAGLGALPGGAALYAYDVEHNTTTNMTPAEIHALGLQEVQRISRELAKLQASVHVKGSLQDFFAQVRADPAQHFVGPEEVLPAFQAARDRIVPKLPPLFGVLPRTPYELRALPESYRQSRDNGYYSAAAADGSRPGILWINIYAPGVQDRFNVMTISLHEGLPGHHFQTSIAQERIDLPSFRRHDTTNAYLEGWGLYAESLGEEMGFYQDLWQRYGHLNYAMLRANRLVIDTGIHSMGWSIERGIAWMTRHSSMSREQAAAEVERYAAYPGQALSYKIGELTLLELRAQGRQRLQTRFDLRAFHDEVLSGGSMPLTILQQRMQRWFEAQAGAQYKE